MSSSSPSPKGDSFGTLGEVVAPLQLKASRPRFLRERQVVLVVLTAGVLVGIADTASILVALPAIAESLGLAGAGFVWVLSAYLIAYATALLLSDRLTATVGGKRLFVLGMSLFGVASLLGGAADEASVLVVARFAQGLGAGCAAGTAIRTISRTFPRPREEAKAHRFHGMSMSLAPLAAFALAAALIPLLGWRAGLIVLGVLALLLARAAHGRLFNEEVDYGSEPGDLRSPMLALLAAVVGVHALVELAEHGWRTWQGVVILPLAAALAYAYARSHVTAGTAGRDALRGKATKATVLLGVAHLGGWIGLVAAVSYVQAVLGRSVLTVALVLLCFAAARVTMSVLATPVLMRRFGLRASTTAGLVLLAAGLGWIGRMFSGGSLLADVVLPLVSCGMGLSLAESALTAAIVGGARGDERATRVSLADAGRFMVAGVGLPFVVGIAVLWNAGELAGLLVTAQWGAAILLTASVFSMATRLSVHELAPDNLDPGEMVPAPRPVDLRGAKDADLVAIGLGGPNMMAMLWSIAKGKRAVGVELRGSPTQASMHFNIHEDMWHHLAEIDRLMLECYGEERIPRKGNGDPFILHECFFNPCPSSTGDARADEVITGFIPDSHIAGVIESFEEVDDRWVDGEPSRSVDRHGSSERPRVADPLRIGRRMRDALDERPTFLVGAADLLVVLRRYLSEMERMDLEAEGEPRCRVFTYHRVLETPDGFMAEADGRQRIKIEPIHEMDDKGGFRRIRVPGAEVIDLGVPELFIIAEGADSQSASRLGFEQELVKIDRNDGRGPVNAHADYLVGLMTMYVGSRCRRRISSEFDRDGNEYWVRQEAIGHEEDGEIGWFVTEVPDYKTFDPVMAGLVPPGTGRSSAEYFAGYDWLVREYFLDQVSILTEVPRSEVTRISVARQPTLVGIDTKVGVDAKVAANGVVIGDSFGTSAFLSSAGVNTGLIGHAARVLLYWRAQEEGASGAAAIDELAASIKIDTLDYIDRCRPMFEQPARPASTEPLLAGTRDLRRSAVVANYRDDWSRVQVFVGRLFTSDMPELLPTHPLRRTEGEGVSSGIRAATVDAPRPEPKKAGYGRFGHRRTVREGVRRRLAP